MLGHAEAVMFILARAGARGLAEGQVLRDGVAGRGPSVCRDLGVCDDFRVSTEPSREDGHRAEVDTRATGGRRSDDFVEAVVVPGGRGFELPRSP